jgi:hypothetical protein
MNRIALSTTLAPLSVSGDAPGPVSQSLRAFNPLGAPPDRLTEEEIDSRVK